MSVCMDAVCVCGNRKGKNNISEDITARKMIVYNIFFI